MGELIEIAVIQSPGCKEPCIAVGGNILAGPWTGRGTTVRAWNVDRDMLLAAIDRLPEADPCDEMLGLSEKNGWGTRDADDRAWVLSRFREWDSAASLFPASDRPIAIRLAIRLLTLKEDAVEQPWNDVDRTLPPSGVFVETMRTGERLPNVCAWQWARLGTDIEWYERGKPGDPGRTTVTHSTFIPPTHWRPIRTGSAS